MRETQFKQWLLDEGYSENAVKSRIANVRKIEEVYPDLDSRIYDGTISNLLATFVYTADDRLNNREPLHKIKINGDAYNGTATYKSALSLYIKFYNDINGQPSAHISSNPNASHHIGISRYPENLYDFHMQNFKWWMQSEDGMSKNSADSYLSSLNYINKRWYLADTGRHVMEAISELFFDQKSSEAIELLELTDESLSKRLESDSTSQEDKKRLSDARSALRKYVQFWEEHMEDVPDEEDFENVNLESLNAEDVQDNMMVASGVITYPIADLEKNFSFRLATQNRMSNDKNIFYPIGIIRKLFRYSQRNARLMGRNNNDYDDFKRWMRDNVGKIIVITNQGSFPLNQFKELIIDPNTKRVQVIPNAAHSGERVYSVMTETNDGKSSVVPMQADSLRGIHIDHTPLMTDVLRDYDKELPSLKTLTKIIKDVATQNRISIEPSNFGEISRKLFADEERVENEMLPLIPTLKEELNILRSKCSLKLMEAKYNLTKK